MNNIALGRYIPLDSIIHKLDPRAKIVCLILWMIAIFIPAGWWGYGVICAAVLTLTLLAKLKLRFLWRSMRPMLFMLVFLLIINVLVLHEGTILFQIGSFTVYSGAILQTLYIVIRLMLMIMLTTVLTATTKPLELTLGLEDLMAPLKVIHVPAHEIAMMISIALRFIPTLIEETQRIMKAQASRGVDMEEGSLKEKVMAILSLIVPLFVSAFQHADDLANAMEARGYVPSQTRTRYQQLKMRLRDYVVLVLSVVLLVCLFGLAWMV